jgi:hypothetical protein
MKKIGLRYYILSLHTPNTVFLFTQVIYQKDMRPILESVSSKLIEERHFHVYEERSIYYLIILLKRQRRKRTMLN